MNCWIPAFAGMTQLSLSLMALEMPFIAMRLNFDTGYQEFKIGEMLKMARKETSLTQEDIAIAMHTQKSAISRAENTTCLERS